MMSDEEDYSSGTDEDYVPSDKEGLSEEEESGEDEDLALLKEGGDADASTTPSKKGSSKRKRKKKDDLLPRKRKGGIKLEGDDDEGKQCTDNQGEDEEHKKLQMEMKQEEESKKLEKEKKKADDLWSSFLTDVSSKPKRASQPATSSGLGAVGSSISKPKPTTTNGDSKTIQPPTSSKKITVTKVFDFAGEAVKVTEEVDIKSREGQKEIKRMEEEQTGRTSTSLTDISTSESPPEHTPSVVKSLPKPAGGLGSVLGRIGKKNTISTLNKSKLDWESFKKDEGIDDDLRIHNRGKEGYTERMAFLQRADVRQFEIEKKLRQTSSKR